MLEGHLVIDGSSKDYEIYLQEMDQIPPVNIRKKKNPLGFLAGKGKIKHFEIGQSSLFTTRDALKLEQLTRA